MRQQLHVLIRTEEMTAAKKAADAQGLSLSDYVRVALSEKRQRESDWSAKKLRGVGALAKADLAQLDVDDARAEAEAMARGSRS